MSILRRLMNWFGLQKESPGLRSYQFSENDYRTLSTLASHENRSEEELATDIFAAGLTQYYETYQLWDTWESLTPREKETTALVCLRYSNRKIAERMVISTETVKFHVHNVLRKYDVKSRSQLQQLLVDWDFGGWKE